MRRGHAGEDLVDVVGLLVPGLGDAEAVAPRYRALVLLGAFTSLRWGELCALRRTDIDLAARTVRVQRTLTELQRGGLAFGPPKSDAGTRLVVFPKLITPALSGHLANFVATQADALIFTAPSGVLLRRSNFRRRVWLPAIAAAHLPPIHFHDLRQTGNHLTANSGANLRELMARMGHSSTRAALVYLHLTDERQREIADSLNQLAKDQLRRARRNAPRRRSGTQRARQRKDAS
jgi:integrase